MLFIGFRDSPGGTRLSSQRESQRFIRSQILNSGVMFPLTLIVLTTRPEVNHRWFRRPEFLYHTPERWPKKKRIREEETSEDCQAEIANPKTTFATDVSEPLMDPLKYSSWTRLIRVTAWVMRFVAKLSTKVKKRETFQKHR